MGTKNEPGVYDCYEKAEPDEPIFVLLALACRQLKTDEQFKEAS